MTLLAISLVTAITGAAATSSADPIREGLFASTNYWGRNVDRFLDQSNAAADMMRRSQIRTANTTWSDWYAALLDLPVPTNSVEEYRTWLNVKARCLAGYSKRILNPMHTNLWMKYAAVYGDIRAGVRSSKSLLTEAKALFPFDQTMTWNKTFENGVAMKKWLWRQSEWDAAREKALGEMWFGISEYIGTRGISKLPDDVREEFLAEFERRARLNESERAQIRAEIDSRVNSHKVEKTRFPRDAVRHN